MDEKFESMFRSRLENVEMFNTRSKINYVRVPHENLSKFLIYVSLIIAALPSFKMGFCFKITELTGR